MSRKVTDEEGNEIEIPTDKELKQLKEDAKKAGKTKEFNQFTSDLKKSLGIGEKDSITKAIKDITDDNKYTNFKKMRDTVARLTKALKDNIDGVEIDEDGNVTTKEGKQLTPEDIDKRAYKAGQKAILDDIVTSRLAKYPKDKRETVEKTFKKQIAGEELSREVIEKGFTDTNSIVFPTGDAPTTNISPDGGEPELDAGNKKDYAETEEGKKAAKELFEEDSYSHVEDKKED